MYSSFFYKIIFLFLPLIFLISPFLFFILSIFFLMFINFEKVDILRRVLSLLIVFSLIFIYSSIDFSSSETQDYYIYYQANEIIKFEKIKNILNWPFKTEFGWGVIFWLIHKLGFNINTINQVAIINFSLSLILFYIWFEKYGIKSVDESYRGIATASVYLFISVITLSFLQRQSLSVIALLFAISNTKNNKFYLYTFIASIFHITSLPVAILYKFLINKNISKIFFIYVFLFMIFVRLTFINILNVISNIELIQDKVGFYLAIDGFSIVSLRLALYTLLLAGITFFYVKDVEHRFKNIIIFVSICSLCLLGINLASERINFITIYLYGYFLFLMLYRKNLYLLLFINIIFLIIFVYERSGLFINPANLWVNYGIDKNFFDFLNFFLK